MTELPHRIRETLPQDAKHRADTVADEMRAFAEQHSAIMSQTFGGKFDHNITVGGGSAAALDAVRQMVGNVDSITHGLNTMRPVTRGHAR